MLKWYVFQSKFRKESLVCEQLRIHNLDSFFPYVYERPVNPRARGIKPYFPGYVFGRLDLEHISRSIVDWIPGAIGIVSFGGEPIPVPDHLINALQEYLETINAAKSKLSERFQLGDFVTIRGGPFAGYEAIFNAHLPGRDRVEVLLNLLQGPQIRVQLPVEQITPNGSSLVNGTPW